MRSGKRRQPEIYMAYELSRVELSRAEGWKPFYLLSLCVCVLTSRIFYLPPEMRQNC